MGGFVKKEVAQGFKSALANGPSDPIVQKIRELMKPAPAPTAEPQLAPKNPKEEALKQLLKGTPNIPATPPEPQMAPQPGPEYVTPQARKMNPEQLDQAEALHIQDLMQQDPSLQVPPEKLQRLQKYFKPTE